MNAVAKCNTLQVQINIMLHAIHDILIANVNANAKSFW